MKTRYICSNWLREARSGGYSTLAASQTRVRPYRKAPEAIAMTQWIGYNARKELPKSAANDSLERCLARRCLEWLLERREAAGRGKTGGGSFEIEIQGRKGWDRLILGVGRREGAHWRMKRVVSRVR